MTKQTKKIWIPVLSIVGVGLFVGVGFATWTIAGESETQSANLTSINAEELVDQRVTLTTSTTEAQSLSFSSKDSTNKYSWLSRDGKSEEKLDFSFTFALASKDGTSKISDLLSSVTYQITVNDKSSNGWASAVSAGYVSSQITLTAPESKSIALGTSYSYAATSLTGSSANVSISGSFAWGTHFGSENPYAYYNSHASGDKLSESSTKTYAEDAKTSLSALVSDLSGVTFTLKVTTTPKTAA